MSTRCARLWIEATITCVWLRGVVVAAGCTTSGSFSPPSTHIVSSLDAAHNQHLFGVTICRSSPPLRFICYSTLGRH